MRKTFAVVLSALMILSLLCIGVSAAEGTAIKTAEDFAAMTADGTYYLDADITVNASYGAGETPVVFTGVLDGNGHTITLSAPLFAKFSGTLKNVKLAGAIKVTEAKSTTGAICNVVDKNSTVVLENIETTVKVEAVYRTGGLIGQLSNGSKITMKNCVNNGSVTVGTPEATDSGMIGGFIGYQQGDVCEITDCVNNAAVTATIGGPVGGFFGRFGGDNEYSADRKLVVTNCLNTGKIEGSGNAGGFIGLGRGANVTFTNCTNKGEVTSSETDAGGIFGHAGAKGYLVTVTFNKCLNEGKVSELKTTADPATKLPTSGTCCAGGILGYCYGSGTTGVAYVYDCVNKGEINCADFASHFIGYTNQKLTEIKNSSGEGKLVGGAKLIVGMSSADNTLYVVEGVKLAAGDATEYFSYATAESNAANIVKLADYLAIEGNAAKITLNAAPASLAGIGYQAPATPEQPTDPTTPDTPVTPATPTGDSLVAVVAVAAVALFGMAVAVKKKEN